jgi:hypothetical protein
MKAETRRGRCIARVGGLQCAVRIRQQCEIKNKQEKEGKIALQTSRTRDEARYQLTHHEQETKPGINLRRRMIPRTWQIKLGGGTLGFSDVLLGTRVAG